MIEEETKNFLDDSIEFIESFKDEFVDYFIELCRTYKNNYEENTLRDVGALIYQDIFKDDIFITTFEGNIFSEMKEDGVLVGFLINKLGFFLIEKYIEFFKNKSVDYSNNLELLVRLVHKYTIDFEIEICKKNIQEPYSLNFDTEESHRDDEKIYKILENIGKNKKNVTFFNLYEGIPISSEGKIIKIENDEITFNVDKLQKIAMLDERVAYILKNDDFTKYIKADIIENSFHEDQIVLGNFSYLFNMPAMNRTHIRVYPEALVHVKLELEPNLITNGILYDLSVSGLGVISSQNNGIFAGAKVDISFDLDFKDGLRKVLVYGEILNIIEYKESYRYCIKIFPNSRDENFIDQYVKSREINILNTLEEKTN
jgi:hypothetical protein